MGSNFKALAHGIVCTCVCISSSSRRDFPACGHPNTYEFDKLVIHIQIKFQIYFLAQPTHIRPWLSSHPSLTLFGNTIKICIAIILSERFPVYIRYNTESNINSSRPSHGRKLNIFKSLHTHNIHLYIRMTFTCIFQRNADSLALLLCHYCCCC